MQSSNYILAVVVSVAAVFLLAFVVTCIVRLAHRRKSQEVSESQPAQVVLYPEAVDQRASYEPHYVAGEAVQNRVVRERSYFNFQDLERHPFDQRLRRPSEETVRGPVMAVAVERTQEYRGEPYVGTLVFDEDVERRQRRGRRAREPVDYGEAVYVPREDSTRSITAERKKK